LNGADVKAFAELAILYGCLQEWQPHLGKCLALRQDLVQWRDFVLRHVESPEYAQIPRKHLTHAFYFLLPYLLVRATGYRSWYHEDTLRRLGESGYLTSTELVPYRVLDRLYFLWKSGYFDREPHWHSLYRQTFLGQRWRCSVHIDREAAYSITHTLFYLTDFGNRPAPLKAREIERIWALVESLLIHYWRLCHWDLVGELLIALNCLDRRQSSFYAGAARALRHAVRGDGAVPADAIALRSVGSTQGDEQADVVFRSCYHATLVNVLYGCTALNRYC
jgi:hypothetical protein